MKAFLPLQIRISYLPKKKIHFLAVLITAFFFVTLYAAPASCGEKHLKKVSFMPQWLPQAQFAGYYVAHEKGIYEKYGLDVEIMEGGPDRSPCEFLKDGKADFVTLWLSTGIKERARGVKVINIAQIMQKSGFMLIAKKSSLIRVPKDLNNKKIGLWDNVFQVQVKAFLKKNNIKASFVPQLNSLNIFLLDGVDAASAMWYNEYHTVLSSGYDPEDLTTFFLSDMGLNFPEDGIYTLQGTFENDPESSFAFAKASIEGWLYAFGHPEEALDITIKYMKKEHLPVNEMHQKWMLERMKDLILSGKQGSIAGQLSQEDYDTVRDGLKECGIIDNVPEFEDFHKDFKSYVKK